MIVLSVLYMAKHSRAKGGNTRNPRIGISKIFT